MKTKLTCLRYLGYTSVDKRFSNAMLPWLLKEIRRMGIREKLSVAIEEGYLKGYNQNFEPVIVHRLVDIIRACQVPGNPEELLYLLVNDKDNLLYCYLFRADNASEVTDLFNQMREPSPVVPSPRSSTTSLNANVTKNVGFQNQSSSNEHLPWSTPSISLPRNCNLNLSTDTQSPLIRTTSNASTLTTTLTSLSADLSPAESHFFEVLYIGKVKISQRKVPDTLIDDALHKFAQHEAEKAKINQLRRNSLLSSQGTTLSSNDSKEDITEDKNKTETRASEDITKKLNLTSTSTTPLEPDKKFSWKSVDNISESTKNKHEESPKRSPILGDEFQAFTKERIDKRPNNNNIRKPNQTPLEPTVLILNVPPKKNLTTLQEDEEKVEDLNTVFADTAASITEFYRNERNFSKDGTPIKDANANDIETAVFKENNPFLADIKKQEINKNIIKNQREDSPSPSLKFDEIPRKPKLFLRSKSGLDAIEISKKNSMPENKPFLRDRSASIGTLSIKTPLAQLIGEQNRTMLFQVGRSELRLISPDRKQILLHRGFKDVASCVLGRTNEDHFGFVCRDTGVEGYACYVFKCESHSVAQEVVGAIKQAFISHAEFLKKTRDKPINMTCEHCPMLWYHRLCHDTEGMNEKKIHAFILRRIEQLGDEEQDQIVTKYQGGTNHMYEVSEHNAFLMMLLRAHCEAKQQRHVHDTAENRSEFLNQYLGGSTIFMKAKRSLSSGFDHLLKRKASKDEGSMQQTLNVKKEQSPGPINDSASEPSAGGLLPPDVSMRSKSLSPGVPNLEPPPSPTSISGTIPTSEPDVTPEQSTDDNCKSPMMEIFLKVSDSRSSDPSDDNDQQQSATWRQAIYQKVVQTPDNVDEELSPENILNLQPTEVKSRPGKRTKEELRKLWKMAIDQTVLLVRMEKENARLKQSEESSAVRRIKLEYIELGTVDAGITLMWDSLLASRSHQIAKVDHHMLTQAVIQGVPRMYRGNIWYFLAEQACLRAPPLDPKRFPFYSTPYHTLLAGLTKYQHAILIDLGRTFPQHSYFASALGPGQLSLYNILKAYSLVDPDVGYCQGLSFVAATLLLHMEEAEAFTLLRHLMFRRGLRKQYLPDMSALQVQLYQLSRLLRDHEPDLHAKLESLDISPALYAAPWMLTLFTSQFPLGFVVRVFDLIFLESLDIVFSVSLALLSVHKDGIMLCESCEEGAEYLKHKLPDIDQKRYDKVMKKVHSMDISRQLTDYAVEYAVLREEMPRVASLTINNKKLLKDNNKMSCELDSAMEALTKYQNSQTRLENQIKLMDHQLVLLSKFLSAHHRTDLPMDLKKITQTYTKKSSFGSKIFSSKFTSNDEEEEKTFKTGVSSPNLFSKISKEDIINATNKDKRKSSPESDKRSHFIMKKSQSVHSGLKANNLKHTLKVLEEKSEKEVQSNQFVKELFNKKGYRNTHEQIEQERMFEQQLKHDFDENLKRLDAKMIPNDISEDDDDIFRNKKSLSLNFNIKRDDKSLNDSGFVTPLTPNDSLKRDDMSVVSHPLSDCDVDIQFDGQLTKLKQIRPMLKQRTHSVDEYENKTA